MLQKNEAILLNEIIEKIYIMADYRQMRITLLEMLDTLIPYQQASFYLASKEKEHRLADPVGKGIPQSELQRYIDEYEDKDYTRWIFMSGKTMVYRETDLFPDRVRQDNAYYKDIYIPAKIYYSAQMSIARGDTFLGIISLYRNKGQGDFTDNELFLLELLKDHLDNRANIEWGKEKNELTNIKNKVSYDAYHFVEQYGLTTREVEVLGLLFAGIPNSTICDTLVISPNTLKKHALSIYKKLGINNRWELINIRNHQR